MQSKLNTKKQNRSESCPIMSCKTLIFCVFLRIISFLSPKNPIYIFTGRFSDSASTPHAAFSAFANDLLHTAPLHSSGPVGESHSVPFSPAYFMQAPVNFQYSDFENIIAYFPQKVKLYPGFSPYAHSSAHLPIIEKLKAISAHCERRASDPLYNNRILFKKQAPAPAIVPIAAAGACFYLLISLNLPDSAICSPLR